MALVRIHEPRALSRMYECEKRLEGDDRTGRASDL